MDAPSQALCRRSWRSLVTDRWHTSSRVVTALLLFVLAFCNLPGQSVKRMWYELGHPFYVRQQFEHGWPLNYLVRADNSHDGWFYYRFAPPPPRTVRDCFALSSDVEQFHPWSLLANAFIALLASVALGAAFEAWRRQRAHLLQFHLKDLFATTLAISLAAAWWVHVQRRYAREQAAFFPPGEESGRLSIRSTQLGGVTWLRTWLGDEHFQFLDRPFAVAVHEPDGWSRLEKLTTIRHVDAEVRGTTEDLAHLAKLPNLEALSLDESHGAPPDGIVAQLPPLPRLRGLYVTHPVNRCRGIDRLPSLEALRITESGQIDGQALREIALLPNIRHLALNGLPKSADLRFLPSRPRLSALDLYNSDVSRAALKSIGQCLGLKELSFYMCRVDGSGMSHLSRLANLETLDLDYTNVVAADLTELGGLSRLRELKLTATEVSGDLRFMASLENLEYLSLYFNTKVKAADLGPLVHLTRLRSLDLGYTHLGEDATALLRQMNQLKWLRVSIGPDALQELPERAEH